MKKYIPLLYIYLILGLITIYSRLAENQVLEYAVKPGLMICLGLFFVLASEKRNAFFRSVLLALFFSWLGDVFLMYPHLNEIYFTLGLGAFLIAHIFYISAFYLNIKEGEGKSLLLRKPYWLIPFLVYGAGLMYVLAPNLGDMMIPVVVYAFTLLLMSIMALNRHGFVSLPSFYLVLTGALIFILSDSMIALNKFYKSFAFAGGFIMFAYVLAQYLIVLGSLYHLNNPNNE